MSLHATLSGSVPASTAAVARAAFPRGNPYLSLRDAFGPVFADLQFAALFPSHGQPAEVPWRLAPVTLLQYAETLSDRRAADAARGRIDWKYLLGLELADLSSDIRNPSRGDTENPATSATVMPRRMPVRMSP